MTRTVDVRTLRAAARAAGGMLEPDGTGGYELAAPEGKRWAATETRFQPVPLSECEGKDERRELLESALRWALAGLEDA